MIEVQNIFNKPTGNDYGLKFFKKLNTEKQRVLIGLSGNHGVGKNFTADQIAKIYKQHGYNVSILSLADELKKDLQKFLWEKFNINILDCTREEKNRVRPILVEYARIKRVETLGQHYPKILQDLPEFNSSDVVIITDIRYIEYLTDEYYWLRQHGGKLIHIHRKGCPPANEDELDNNAKLEFFADEVIEPPYYDGEVDLDFYKQLLKSLSIL
jgi:hypothetical protein